MKLGKFLQKTGGIFDNKIVPIIIAGILLFTASGLIEFRYFRTKQMRVNFKCDAYLRTCPIPKDRICPALLIIPKGSLIKVYPETQFYMQANGYKATWKKVEFESQEGWINESLLDGRPNNCAKNK